MAMFKNILILFVFLFLHAGSAYAQTPPPYNNGDWTKTSCSFEDWIDAVGDFEGGPDQYTAKNQYGYLGRYQFGDAALQDLGYKNSSGGWTGQDGINSESDFLSSPGVQDKAFAAWSEKILNRDIENYSLTEYIGQTIGDCRVTRSGLMAGRHLKGVGCKPNGAATACENSSKTPALWIYLASNGAIDPTDGNGMPVSAYVCAFGGYETPYGDDSEATGPCGNGRPNGHGGNGGGGGSTGGNDGKAPASDPDGDGGYVPRDLIEKNNEGIRRNWIAALQLMAKQFTANMMAQVEMFGMILDAKHQLETQRLLQEKMAQAHKDYQPSEQMCTFGTFAKDLAATQASSEVTKLAISTQILQGELRSGDSKDTTEAASDLSRLSKFRSTFCNPNDLGGGLALLCPTAAPALTRNLDINYTKALDQPLSLEINMMDGTATSDEASIFALVDNLFAHETSSLPTDAQMNLEPYRYHYLNYRSVVAMRGIARNSIANIIAMKTESPYDPSSDVGSGPYLKALMRDLGLSNAIILDMLGTNPSYYAQMEMLTKKIYQNPAFYTALYDKPANVERVRAAMRAIKLMQDRDIQLAFQRREMLLSMMLELRLRERADSVYDATYKSIFRDGS